MIRIRVIVAVVIPALAGSHELRADEAGDARAIVERGIKAMGPEDVLARHKAHAWKVKGKISLMGQSLPYGCEYMFQEPDRFRFVMDMEFMGQKVQLTAAGVGGKAWEQAAGQVRDMPEDKLKEFNHNIYTIWISSLLPLRDPAFKLTTLGETKSITGQTHVGIKVSREGQRDVTLFFDKNTGLLARTITRVHDEFSNKEVTQEVTFSDYKAKDGVTAFGKMVITRDGKPFIEEELYDHRGLEKVDEALFKKP
jgi:hypothetical protein